MSTARASDQRLVPQATSFRSDVLALDPVRLIGMRCEGCAAISFPRRDSCPACGSIDGLHERPLTPRGLLCSWSIVRNAPAGLRTPYVLAYVDLVEDGVRIMSRVVEVEESDLAVGLPLVLTVIDVASTRSTDRDPDVASELMFAFRPLTEEQR